MNADEREAFEMVHKHERLLTDIEARLAALEALADDKEGAPKKAAAKKTD